MMSNQEPTSRLTNLFKFLDMGLNNPLFTLMKLLADIQRIYHNIDLLTNIKNSSVDTVCQKTNKPLNLLMYDNLITLLSTVDGSIIIFEEFHVIDVDLEICGDVFFQRVQ